MPYEDFVSFQIKAKISPLKNQRLDHHHALLMWQLARINADPKKFKQTPADYMPFKPEKPPQTDQEIENAIMSTLSRV